MTTTAAARTTQGGSSYLRALRRRERPRSAREGARVASLMGIAAQRMHPRRARSGGAKGGESMKGPRRAARSAVAAARARLTPTESEAGAAAGTRPPQSRARRASETRGKRGVVQTCAWNVNSGGMRPDVSHTRLKARHFKSIINELDTGGDRSTTWRASLDTARQHAILVQAVVPVLSRRMADGGGGVCEK